MTRAQMLAAASKKYGSPIAIYRLDYALKMGYVRAVDRRPDGWSLYDQTSVDDLVRYMRERSRPTATSA